MYFMLEYLVTVNIISCRSNLLPNVLSVLGLAMGSFQLFWLPPCSAAVAASAACLSIIFCSLRSLESAPCIMAAWKERDGLSEVE